MPGTYLHRRSYRSTKSYWADGFSAKTIKARFNAAMKELRQMGFWANQNFLCCSSCAGYEYGSRVEKEIDKDPKKLDWFKDTTKFKGIVFFHRQDGADLREHGSFMLRYGPVASAKYNPEDDDPGFGLPAEESGKIICSVLTKHEIKHEWDGSPDKCIDVDLANSPTKTRAQRTIDDLKRQRSKIKDASDQLVNAMAVVGDEVTPISYAVINDANTPIPEYTEAVAKLESALESVRKLEQRLIDRQQQVEKLV